MLKARQKKERIKYAVVKSAGMSADRAKKVFGFHNMNRRAEAMELAYKEACKIKESIMNIAHLKDRALLGSLGLQDTISDNENSDSEDDDELSEQSKEQFNHYISEQNNPARYYGRDKRDITEEICFETNTNLTGLHLRRP